MEQLCLRPALGETSWAPAGMGKGALAPTLWKCKVFLCISSYSKTLSSSVNELFMHYFYNLSSSSGDKGAQTPTGALSLDPLGYFRPQTSNLPIIGKKILRAPVVNVAKDPTS